MVMPALSGAVAPDACLAVACFNGTGLSADAVVLIAGPGGLTAGVVGLTDGVTGLSAGVFGTGPYDTDGDNGDA